jgi:hypothetical protein
MRRLQALGLRLPEYAAQRMSMQSFDPDGRGIGLRLVGEVLKCLRFHISFPVGD